MIVDEVNNEFDDDKNFKILYNKNSGEKIDKIKIANSFFKRFLGLMFKARCDYPLLFEIPQDIKVKERSTIHSLFMRFELMLVFIDEENLIYEIGDLKPWRYYVPKKRAKYIIEFDKKSLKIMI